MTIRNFIKALIAWSIIGFVHSTSRFADKMKYQPESEFSLIDMGLFMLSYSFWISITLVLIYIFKKIAFPFAVKTLTWMFFIILVCWLPLYFSMDYAASTMIDGGSFTDFQAKIINTSSSGIFFYAVVYALTFAACLGIVLTEKTNLSNQLNASLKQQRTEDALILSKQKMQLMQSQLSPHFLFNCLGAISGLARTGEKVKIVEATARVGDLLRFTVSNSAVEFITIEEELSFVEDYVALQKLRFDRRFLFNASISLPDKQLTCPPFTIQPLIENAFCHAVEATEETINIDFTVTYDHSSVLFTVCNTVYTNQHKSNGSGTGLLNLRSRLTHLYNNRFSLNIEPKDSLFTVKLCLPIDREEKRNV
jgi:sensor histidine kinase YesM